jgi:uncharacterized protein
MSGLPESKIVQTVIALPARGLLGLIRLYQLTLSPVLPVVLGPNCGCRFYPSCSHYAAGAIRTHGALRGAGLTAWRLLRCNPLNAGGLDPVPIARPRRQCARVESSAAPTRSVLSAR